jgi:hypothetical protein
MINERYFCLDDLPNERWKDIKDFEGLYRVSTYSRIKSLKREKCNNQFSDERILKYFTNDRNRCQIGLYKDGKAYSFHIHKLVADAFIPKETFKSMPNENRNEIDLSTLEINHKDENPSNNCVDNLEWCTRLYNCNYGTRNKKLEALHEIKVNQYSLDGKFIKTWNSLTKAAKALNCSQPHISDVCNGKRKTTGGYIWKYYEEVKDELEI